MLYVEILLFSITFDEYLDNAHYCKPTKHNEYTIVNEIKSKTVWQRQPKCKVDTDNMDDLSKNDVVE